MAARWCKQANETAELGLRDAYRQLALGYMRLAVQREAIEHCRTLIGRFDAENVASDSCPAARATIGRAMSIAAFRSRLGVLGLSVRSFAAMTGVHYETARHWGGSRSGIPQEFPRWVPLVLEMMDPTVSRKPPDDAVRPRPRSDKSSDCANACSSQTVCANADPAWASRHWAYLQFIPGSP
jgi:hypothetical protein